MRHLTHICMLAAVSFVVGCGEGASLTGTTAATGTVTYKGQPVEGATVIFSPTVEGRAASGRTDAEGAFELTTLSASDGVMPGTYSVAISKTEMEGGLSGEEAQKYFEEHNAPPPAATRKELLPAKYKDAATSGLTANITEGGENNFTFELVD